MTGRLLMGACLLAIAAAPAEAAVNKAKVRQVMEAAGLMGFWAQDCTRPPGPDNAWETLTVDEEGYVIDADYEGTDGESAYVTDARRLGPDKVWFKYEVTLGEPELELVYEVKGDRHRTWSSKAPDGTDLITAGRWATDETPEATVWYGRCPANRFPDQPADAE